MIVVADINQVSNKQDGFLFISGRLATRPGKEHPNPEYWKALKAQAVLRFNGMCGTCPSPGVDLHHRHYDNFGNESIEDVIFLCRDCHRKVSESIWARRERPETSLGRPIGDILTVRGKRQEPAPVPTGGLQGLVYNTLKSMVESQDSWWVNYSDLISNILEKIPKPDGRDIRKAVIERATTALAIKQLIVVQGDERVGLVMLEESL